MRAKGMIAAGAALALCVVVVAEAGAQNGSINCKSPGGLVRLAELPEASGLASARGHLWSHNDSGAPVLIALDSRGTVAGRVTLSGARVEDWEALAAGPCPSGSCLYVGDIGDNNGKRATITVYRLTEPTKPSGSVAAEAFHASYPDGAQDAEALLVAPDGTVLIVTKGDTGPIAVYRFPKELRRDATMRLERLGKAIAGKPGNKERITDGAISPDGKLVVLRTREALTFYRGPEFLRGEFQVAGRFDATALGEPQGEAVAFGQDGVVYLAGEGGGKKVAGTLGTLACRP
jgi:hypothetical protein